MAYTCSGLDSDTCKTRPCVVYNDTCQDCSTQRSKANCETFAHKLTRGQSCKWDDQRGCIPNCVAVFDNGSQDNSISSCNNFVYFNQNTSPPISKKFCTYVDTTTGGACQEASSDTNCGTGYYNDVGQCKLCRATYYCDGVNHESCPAPHSSSDEGASSVNQCYRVIPAGKEFDNTDGIYNDITCHAGGYCPGVRMEYGTNKDGWGWAACGAGNYCPEGSSAPTICPAGYKCPTNEEEAPTACPSGTYQNQEGKTTCENCTNKPNGATYKANETAVSKNNACSWKLPKCSNNQKLNLDATACENCQTGYHNTIDWNTAGLDGICFYSSDNGKFLCKSDYTKITNITIADAKTCAPNVYTVNVYAEYKNNGTTSRTTKLNTASISLTYSSSLSTIMNMASAEQHIQNTINNLNKGPEGSGITNTEKYYAPTKTDQAYLEINGTKYNLETNYSGNKDNANWMLKSDKAALNALGNLANGATINLVLKIQSNKYNVVMLPYATNSDKSTTAPAQITQKDFGDTPSTGVSPDKTEVTKCVSSSKYGYIADNAAAKYYECTLALNAAPTLYGDGKTAMFEPSVFNRHICIGYTMTTCDAGYKCSSCSLSVCDNGTHQNASGQSSCSNCDAGTFAPDDNQPHKSCSPCDAGKYQPDTGKSSCSNCPAGQYQDQTGQTSCKDCVAGYETRTPGTGATSCYQCDAGTYSDGQTNTSCSTCTAGTYSGAGASKCEDCSAGTYSGAGASECEDCSAGTYSGTGASECEPCPAGKYSGKGASGCEPCGAGTYSKEEASECEPCPAGTYQHQSEQPHCISCQDGNTPTTDETIALFTSDSDEKTRPTSRELCYINPNIKLADKFNPDGVKILNNENFEQIFWRGDNPSNSN